MVTYAVSKAALVHLTRVLAAALDRAGQLLSAHLASTERVTA